MGQVFERMPAVHVDWPDIFQVGEWVAVHDVVPNWTFTDAPGQREMKWVALYRVVNGKIQRFQLFS
jgi:hypothetical protein